MSKKDSELIANRIAFTRMLANPSGNKLLDELVDNLCRSFKADNSNFDAELFRKAASI